MYFPEVMLSEHLYLPPRRSHRIWTSFLSIAVLAAIIWHYGILASGLETTEQISIAVLKMLLDLADSIRGFLQFVISHRL